VKVVVAGGTGFVGRALTAALVSAGNEVLVLTRSSRPLMGVRTTVWDPRDANGGWTAELRGADGVVNLCGASIGGGRWTSARKRELTTSRTGSTGALVQAIAAIPAAERPRVLVNASGIDYYGNHPGDEVLDERGAPGDSFLARLCVAWEAAAARAEALGVRVVYIRTAFCVGRNAPALRLLVLPFRLYAGGPLGNGRQWFPWIHLHDLAALYTLGLQREDVSGPLNAVAPNVPREREVAEAIGHVLHRPSLMPAPELALRLLLGEMADLLLHGRNAAPAKAEAVGFHFRYTDVRQALQQALYSA
jgi:uncharacterized protein